MKARSSIEFLRRLNPKDSSYGVKSLSTDQQKKLTDYLFGQMFYLPREWKDIFALQKKNKSLKSAAIMIDFYLSNPKYYEGHLILSKVLEIPELLRKYAGVGTFERTLTKKRRLGKFYFSSSHTGYKNSIKILQNFLRVRETGEYNDETAVKVYERIKDKIRHGEGYLGTELEPDNFFKSGYRQLVAVVDEKIWGDIGIDKKFLVADGDAFWQQKAVDEECEKILKAIEQIEFRSFSFKFANSADIEIYKHLNFERPGMRNNYRSMSQIDQIFTDAEKKARQLLDGMLYEAGFRKNQHELFASTGAMKEYEEYKEAERNYNLALMLYENGETIADWIGMGIGLADDVVVNFPFWLKSETRGVFTTNISAAYAEELAAPGPGWSDYVRPLLKKPPQGKMNEQLSEYEYVRNSKWNYYLIAENSYTIDAHKNMLNKLSHTIGRITNTTYSYQGEKTETALFNQLIKRYLLEVQKINMQEKSYQKYLQELKSRPLPFYPDTIIK